MAQETVTVVVQMLTMTLLVIPWWFFRGMRGMPMKGTARPLLLAAIVTPWLVIAGVSFWIDGLHGMLLGTGAGAGLALIGAVLLTLLQGTRICPENWKPREVDNAGVLSIPTFSDRFCFNFSVSFLALPLLILDGL